MKRSCWSLAAGIVLALAQPAGSQEATKGSTLPEPHRPRIGALIYVPEEHPWGAEIEAGMRAAQKEIDADLTIRRIGFDLLAERREVERFIAEGVDAIVLPAVREDSSLHVIRKANELGISVVCFNTCVAGEDAGRHVDAFVLSDQMELGYQAGAYLAQWLAESGRSPDVAILQCERFEACYRRGQGFRAALDEAGVEWTQVASLEAHSPELAAEAARRILSTEPSLEIFWADSFEATRGVLDAVRGLRERGELGDREVFVFGTELVPHTAELLLDPESPLVAVSSMSTREIGRDAVLAAYAAARGESSGYSLRVLPSPIYTKQDEEELREFLKVRLDER